MSASWKTYVIPHWQSCQHQAKLCNSLDISASVSSLIRSNSVDYIGKCNVFRLWHAYNRHTKAHSWGKTGGCLFWASQNPKKPWRNFTQGADGHPKLENFYVGTTQNCLRPLKIHTVTWWGPHTFDKKFILRAQKSVLYSHYCSTISDYIDLTRVRVLMVESYGMFFI